jgi:hypothetical protein
MKFFIVQFLLAFLFTAYKVLQNRFGDNVLKGMRVYYIEDREPDFIGTEGGCDPHGSASVQKLQDQKPHQL